jgi:hypothetical protein
MKYKNALAVVGAIAALSLPIATIAQSHGSHPSPHGVAVEPFVCRGGGTSQWISQGGHSFIQADAVGGFVGAQYESVAGTSPQSISFVLNTPCDPNTGPFVAFDLQAGGFQCVPCTSAIQRSLGHGQIQYTFTAAQLGISPGVLISDLFIVFLPSSNNTIGSFTYNGQVAAVDLHNSSTSCPPDCFAN